MTRFMTIAVLTAAFGIASGNALALEPGGKSGDTWADFRLSDEPSPSVNLAPSRLSVSEVNHLRQQRAAYIQNQRIARMEANAWAGHEPLRPSWSSIPMMSSRYPVGRRTIIVPYFVP